MSVLVWIEQTQDGPVASCWEVLGKARELADALGTQSCAAVVGSDTAAAAAEAPALWRRRGDDDEPAPALADYPSERVRGGAETGCQVERAPRSSWRPPRRAVAR